MSVTSLSLLQYSYLLLIMALIFYDFETTGLNPFTEEIIEYSFYNFTDNTKLTNYIKPSKAIKQIITRITGITNEILRDQTHEPNHVVPIFKFIGTEKATFLVAHNNDGFDKFFLRNLFRPHEEFNALSKQWKYIDTIPFAKMMMPYQKGYSLKALCKHFNITEGGHRAESDTEALRKVYCKLVAMYCYKNHVKYDYVIKNPQVIYDAIY